MAMMPNTPVLMSSITIMKTKNRSRRPCAGVQVYGKTNKCRQACRYTAGVKRGCACLMLGACMRGRGGDGHP